MEQWDALAALLPPDQAEDVRGFVLIGEQEGAIATLVKGLLAKNVPVADTVRAEIAVLAEEWGTWNEIEDDLRRTAPAPGPTCVKLAAPVPDQTANTQPWLECTTCGGVLHRAGETPLWHAEYFELIDPDGTWGYEEDEIWEAFATLHECCDDPDCRLAPLLAWEEEEDED